MCCFHPIRFSFIVVLCLNDNMSIFGRLYIKVLGICKLEVLEHSWAPLSFAFWIKAKLLCFFMFFLCLFNAIIELHAMDEKMFNDYFN
jgi:hypothetical protein